MSRVFVCKNFDSERNVSRILSSSFSYINDQNWAENRYYGQGSMDQNRLVPDRPRTGPDQDRNNFRNLGPVRTRTETILEIPGQFGPDREKIQILGPDQTRTQKISKSRTEPGQDQQKFRRSGGPWIPDRDVIIEIKKAT